MILTVLSVFLFTSVISYLIYKKLEPQTIDSMHLFSIDDLNQKKTTPIRDTLLATKFAKLISWVKKNRPLVALITAVAILLIVQQYLIAVSLIAVWFIYKSKEKEKLVDEIIQELPNSIVMINRSLKAGLTLERTLENLTQYSPNKSIRNIFSSILYRSHVSGRPMGAVASEVVEPYGVAQLSLLVSVLDTHTKSGGNLIIALEMLESQFRQMYTSKKKVDSLLSESKMSLYVLASIPLLVGGAVYYLNPDHFSIFLTPEGRNGIYYVLGLYLFGLGLGKFLIRS